MVLAPRRAHRAFWLACTAFTGGLMFATDGFAEAAAPAQRTQEGSTLAEIVVTAQRREQNVQDVPIAVTALTQAAIATNRVVTVNDLNLLAPGFNVVPAAGGTQIPSFTMRGITSYGVVPGSDKAISMYVDGVYIASARGSIFDLPDISQIEVLRGPGPVPQPHELGPPGVGSVQRLRQLCPQRATRRRQERGGRYDLEL
jgi:iron complex outermembrane receptor protein